jgi:DNA-nicking Smr family endonuclease
MKRPLKPEDQRLWAMVAATVHPLTARKVAKKPMPQTLDAAARIEPKRAEEARKRLRDALEGIEPNRRHRIAQEREEIGARIDLHGLTQDRARAALDGFLQRAFDDGWRAVLVITGKGVQGDGVLKKNVPGWLGAPHLAHIVAGISDAHRKHGGEGALYVALKRKPRG